MIGGETSISGTISPIDPKLFGSFKTKLSKDGKLLLPDILVNLGFLYDSYKNTHTLHELLTTLLNGISNASGNLWNFQLMIDEDDTATKINITDVKTVDANAELPPTKFKEFKLQSQA